MEKSKIIISSDYDYRFAHTDKKFEIGDTVDYMDKEYEMAGFFRSNNAEKNEIDWVRLVRFVDGIRFECDAYPSELDIISRRIT